MIYNIKFDQNHISRLKKKNIKLIEFETDGTVFNMYRIFEE